ncbi:hypothetical protein O6P43_019862 [Quillaja saponaria]|uniref:Uncharacterized protein n=1 Tax=Quillaja saponaria TaxID=32244 RepID=A0AAD7LJE3_QUISA|nr:hypothetical protein O6P43_019862 [Quillaja saponaria]
MAFPNYKVSRLFIGKPTIIMIAVMTMVLFVATDAVTFIPGRKALQYPYNPPPPYATGWGGYYVPPKSGYP